MKRGLITAGILLMVTVHSFGAFENVGVTARGKSLANAIFADFDGVTTMNYNPANLAQLRSIQTYLSWDTPYTSFNDNSSINTFNVNFAIPFWNSFTIPPDGFFTKRAAMGLSFYRMGVGGVDTDGSQAEFYHEGVYSFYYAKNLNDILSKGAKISAGVKFSVYDIGVGSTLDVKNNPDFTRMGNISFGLDLGVTYDFSETIHIGLAYLNLIAPNVSIMPDGKDTLPSEMHFGMNWEIGDVLWILKKSKLGFGIISYGRDATDNRQADMSWNLGYEFKQLTAGDLFKNSPFKGEMLAFRFGASYQAKKIGDTINLLVVQLQGSFDITAGIGITYAFGGQHQLSLDYCFEYSVNMSALQHLVALSYNFLLPNSSFIYREEAQKLRQMEDLIKSNPGIKEEYLESGMFLSNAVVYTNQLSALNEFNLTNGFVLTNAAILSNGFVLTNAEILSNGLVMFHNELVENAFILTNGFVLTNDFIVKNGAVITNGFPMTAGLVMTNGVKIQAKKKKLKEP